MPADIDRKLSPRQIIKLSIVFAVAYFFSTNGLASLPGITVSFLLKDVLHMTASQASYFGAITLVGWALKPLWGFISDYFPILGFRRRSYLIAVSLMSGIVWSILANINDYSVSILITLFTLSSIAYAFIDVLVDALMIEIGKPLGLTGRFQSIQWTAVYVASIIAGLAGGWMALNLPPQQTFAINAIFPLIILATIVFWVKEERIVITKDSREQIAQAFKKAAKDKQLWLLGFFLFFWTFSPSFGAPFFYYSVDTLKFDQLFFGVVASIGAAASAVGAILYGKFYKRFDTRKLLKFTIVLGTIATLFQLIYFLPTIKENLTMAKNIYLYSNAVLGLVGSITFLTMLNAAALACPKWSEGLVFATLTACWNIGLISSGALGGLLFEKIGLIPLIWISTIFTALTWFILPYLKLGDEPKVN